MDRTEYWKIIARNGVTLLILTLFTFVAVMQYNLIPSIYDYIEAEYGLDTPTPLMLLEAIVVFIGAGMAVVWAYYYDKTSRKGVLKISLSIWVCGCLISAFANVYWLFIMGRLLTAIGIGAHFPLSYGIMADIVPSIHWSTLAGFLSVVSSFGNGFAQFLSSFFTPLDIWGLSWHFPFLLIAIISAATFSLIFFMKLPSRGASSFEELDPELGKKMREGHVQYDFKIKREDVLKLWRIPTNRRLMLSAFFIVIPTAALNSFLIYYMVQGPFISLPDAFRTQIATIFSAMVVIGYFLGVIILGPIIDKIHEKRPKIRGKLSYWGLAIAMPLLMVSFVFIVPIDYAVLDLPYGAGDTEFNLLMYYEICEAIFLKYPLYVPYFFTAFLGSFCAAPMVINQNPILLEINLPEHQGTSQALVYLGNQISKGATYVLLAFQYVLFAGIDLRIIFIVSLLFYLPPIIWWRRVCKSESIDKRKKMIILQDRKEKLKN